MSDPRRPGAAWGLARSAPAVVAWAAGTFLAFRDTFASHFARMQGEPVDTRLVTYILEHSYRWLRGMPAHQSLWSPPVFYPAPNTFAYSDSMLSVAPVYWLLRFVGLSPDTALQWWMLVIGTLNYLVCYVLLRRVVRVERAGAALGALLFAFGGARIAQIRHQQLLPHFYTLVALFAVIRLFETRAASEQRAREWRWPALFITGVVAQCYAEVYLAWFLILSLAIAAAWALAVPRYRRAFLSGLRRHALVLTVASFAGLVALAPLIVHYGAAAREAGYWDFSMIASMLPRLQSWLYMGSQSWLYHRLAATDIMRAIPMEHEQRIGLGIITTIGIIWGLWSARRRPMVGLTALTALTLVVLTLQWPGGLTAWHLVYTLVPGARAIRAVSRICLILLFPAAVGVALATDRLRAHRWLVAALAAIVALEQGQALLAYGKTAARTRATLVAEHVEPGCRAFLFTALHGKEDPWLYHVDAMWAEMTLAIPTINGYSGKGPPGWPFYAAVVRDSASDAALNQGLAAWLAQWKVDPRTVCRVTFDIDSLTRSAR
jgi:hypothetical protein